MDTHQWGKQVRDIINSYKSLTNEERIEKFASELGWNVAHGSLYIDVPVSIVEVGIQVYNDARLLDNSTTVGWDVTTTFDECVIPMLVLEFDRTHPAFIVDPRNEPYDEENAGKNFCGKEAVTEMLRKHLVKIEIADVESYFDEFPEFK